MKTRKEPLITLAEVAKQLNMTRYRVHRLTSEGHLTPIPRPGLKYTYYRQSEVEAFKLKLSKEPCAV